MPFDSCQVSHRVERLNFSEHFVHLTGKAEVYVLVNQQVQGLLLELYDLNAFLKLFLVFDTVVLADLEHTLA